MATALFIWGQNSNLAVLYAMHKIKRKYILDDSKPKIVNGEEKWSHKPGYYRWYRKKNLTVVMSLGSTKSLEELRDYCAISGYQFQSTIASGMTDIENTFYQFK